ncbi:MAG TPA: EAL domain-containing protein [Steroidobacteraceae bacterium]|jgi:diguanylate cyclase (GGDEF)-like protein|nr:EAL domain-containing protein [Steroidobacteraceae bacterium]
MSSTSESRLLADSARHRVLCVDDEPQVLAGLNLQLGRRYEVFTALSGEQALRVLEEQDSIAVIISDMRMPRMNGATFLSKARVLAPHTARILLTGQTDLDAAISAVNEAQVLKFLKKPCLPPDLHAAVETGIEHYRRESAANTGLRRQLRAQLANEDSLTGLASRSRFVEVLEESCSELDGEDESSSLGVLFIHLENLNDINAVQGHMSGDQVLQLTARRLRECCPAALCIARWSEEEFAVLATTDFSDEAAVLAGADALLAKLAVPISLNRVAMRPRACIGIAGIPVHTGDAGTAIKFAGIAARHAKLQGGGTSCLFRSDWAHRIEYRYQLLLSLREAIDNDALHLNYQPVIDSQNRTVRKLEALARWQHPTLGPISPAQFINLAEESGDMPRLGQWILRRACREARSLVGRYCARVAVNVSMHQLLHEGFLQQVDAALHDAQLHPRELELELTESVVAGDADRALAIVTELRARGITVAIDDFGTGYSSLSYLQRFPADSLKVDRSFVATLGTGGETIIAAALSIGRSFGMDVVIEGVETERQRRQLTALGAAQFQGFLYGKPMPLSEIDNWFLSWGFAAASSEIPEAAL